jgi:hypothetical protein
MKLRALTLSSAAVVGALFLAMPASAQQSPYDTNPTPTERAQTEQLNAEAADRANSDANSNDTANDNYNAARSNYDSNRATYDDQRATYERERARYDAEHGGYAHRWDAFYGHDNFRDVGRMSSDELVGMEVNTRAGSQIGRIRDVDTNSDGRVTRVAVRIDGNRTAWVDADDLRFDPGTRIVMTDLSRDQVNDMAHMRYPRF